MRQSVESDTVPHSSVGQSVESDTVPYDNSISQNSENVNTRNEKFSMKDEVDIRYSVKDIDRYTEEEYNDYGWVAVNDVLTGKELKKLYSRFDDSENLKHYYPVTRQGEKIIMVGNDISDADHLVFIKGTTSHPIVTKVVGFVDSIRSSEERNAILEDVLNYGYDFIEFFNNLEEKTVLKGYVSQDFEAYSKIIRYNGKEREIRSSNRDIEGNENRVRGVSENNETIKQSQKDITDVDVSSIVDTSSPRYILSEALKGTTLNAAERENIEKYQQNAQELDRQEERLRELKGQIKEISFSSGKRDAQKLRSLKEEATKTANRIAIYDKKLTRIESMKPIQQVIEREKSLVRTREKQKAE